jgi:hypothetical protein
LFSLPAETLPFDFLSFLFTQLYRSVALAVTSDFSPPPSFTQTQTFNTTTRSFSTQTLVLTATVQLIPELLLPEQVAALFSLPSTKYNPNREFALTSPYYITSSSALLSIVLE